MSAIEKWTSAQQPMPWRDEPRRTAGGPLTEYDGFGRRQLYRPFRLPFWLLFIARIEPARVRRVPASAIVEERLDDDVSLVACPCGAHPVVSSQLAKCGGCERYFARIEVGHIYVAYGAMAPPPLESGRRDGGTISSPSSPTTMPS